MKTFRFGIIGCGLMGREFASASARWCHLPDMTSRPEIIAICDTNESLFPCDLDPQKPINWKRMTQYNGEYGYSPTKKTALLKFELNSIQA